MRIHDTTVGETDLYRVWNGEDAYLYLYDYYVVAYVTDSAIEYHHHKRFRSEEEAEALCRRVAAAGVINVAHWHEVRRMTTRERYDDLVEWERKHDALNGHW